MFKEMFGEAFHLIEKFAPLLAEILVSPAAGVGTAFIISLLNHAFGLEESEDISKKILSDPQAIDKLKDLNKKVYLQQFSNKDSLQTIDVNFKATFDHEKSCDKEE